MDELKRAIALRTGGDTERCHGIRHQRDYPVGLHSWGVAMLMLQLWPEDFPRLAAVCLTHDVPEAWIGDVPATTKRYSPEVKRALSRMERVRFQDLGLPVDEDLPPEDKAKVKACDVLELYFWAIEEVVGGNQHAACIAREVDRFVSETPLPGPAAELYRQARVVYENPARWRLLEHATDEVMRNMLSTGGAAT